MLRTTEPTKDTPEHDGGTRAEDSVETHRGEAHGESRCDPINTRKYI